MNLNELRDSIDLIDREIVTLINKRCELAEKVGSWKRKNSHAIYVPEREKQLLEKLDKINSGPISSSSLKSIYREIISGAIALEEPLDILYIINSKDAARETFGDSANYIEYPSIGKLIKAFKSSKYDYAVIPITTPASEISEEILSELLNYNEIMICGKRHGDFYNDAGQFFIIGRQETAKTGEDYTSIKIQIKDDLNDWENELNQIVDRDDISIALKLEKENLLFLEIAGHPKNKDTEKTLEDIRRKIGNIKILGGYPLL